MPARPKPTAAFATYICLLMWFLDMPALAAPFSVHHMGLPGKALSKDVGQWLGPSTAVDAIYTLFGMFLAVRLSVAVAHDSTLYQSDVLWRS
jgi:cysteine protease ATG4